MRITFIANFRSPIARNGVTYFIEHGYEVHVQTSGQRLWPE